MSNTIAEILDSLAGTLQTQLGSVIDELQVDSRLIPFPTPPSIDIYPATEAPFTEQISFGRGQRVYFFTVRARVGTIDNEGGQDILLKMMDDDAPESVEAALLESSLVRTVEGPSGYGVFFDPPPSAQGRFGCTWRVQVIPAP